jgi:hypothetical protein|tara:strand:+ start:101 stop:247 length:147 start_codon:yes stop_codon:yes gene_type:complete
MSSITILDILLKNKLESLEEPKSRKKEKDPNFLTKEEKLFFYKNGIKH